MIATVFHEFGGPGRLESGEFPDPRPGPGEAAVDVRACGINHLDVWVLSGIPAYKIAVPHAPGSDIAGVVAETGEGVRGVRPGDRVVVYPVHSCGGCPECRGGRENLCPKRSVIGAGPRWGGYASRVVASASNLLSIPPSLPFERAASIPVNYLTAWNMLVNLAGASSASTVLVMGAGSGVGSAALAVGRHLGATLMATASTEAKRARARELGAVETFDHGRADLAKAVKAATSGRGVDVVFEHIGPAVFSQAVQSLAPGGTLVTCGATTGPEAVLDLRFVFSKQLSVKGAYIGPAADFRTLVDLVARGRLDPVIDSTFPAGRAGDALEQLLARRSFGKIVLIHEPGG